MAAPALREKSTGACVLRATTQKSLIYHRQIVEMLAFSQRIQEPGEAVGAKLREQSQGCRGHHLEEGRLGCCETVFFHRRQAEVSHPFRFRLPAPRAARNHPTILYF